VRFAGHHPTNMALHRRVLAVLGLLLQRKLEKEGGKERGRKEVRKEGGKERGRRKKEGRKVGKKERGRGGGKGER